MIDLSHCVHAPAGSEEVIMETVEKSKVAEPLVDAEKSEDGTTAHTDAGNATTQDSSISNGDDADDQQEKVDLKIIWNKNKYDLKIPVDSTGATLKERIHSLTGKRSPLCVPRDMSQEVRNLQVTVCFPRSSPSNAESDV